LSASLALGQLYVVAGSQSSKSPNEFAAALFQLGSAGELRQIDEIAPEGQGIWRVEISYDSRKLVTFSPSGFSPRVGSFKAQTVVVDFDKGRVAKTCPDPPNYSGGFSEWLADVRVMGLSLLQQGVSADRKDIITAMSIDPSIPCDKSFKFIPPVDIVSIVTNGGAGVAGNASNEGIPFGIDNDGRIRTRFFGGDVIYLGFQVPDKLRAAVTTPGFGVMINNSRVLVVVVGSGPIYRELVLRKSDRTWHRVPHPLDLYEGTRSFDHYLASNETTSKNPGALESAGRDEWRKDSSNLGPGTQLFLDSTKVYPGKLHLYYIDTGRDYTITTNRGDSEVLLVEKGLVYYRASDRLYSVPITEKGLGTAHLISTNDVIRDSHWAFIKH